MQSTVSEPRWKALTQVKSQIVTRELDRVAWFGVCYTIPNLVDNLNIKTYFRWPIRAQVQAGKLTAFSELLVFDFSLHRHLWIPYWSFSAINLGSWVYSSLHPFYFPTLCVGYLWMVVQQPKGGCPSEGDLSGVHLDTCLSMMLW